MKFKQKLRRIIKILTIASGLVLVSVITPIFANVGVFVLDVFSKLTLDSANTPTAMTVLGGGLTKKNGLISLNHYSQSRADATITLYTQTKLPIITSGAESPWLYDYIKTDFPESIIISDNASMNTCENAIFTAKLMEHHELPKSVYLITDRYHMARARRQFAQAGISTLPRPAPLAITLDWTKPKNNYTHSRRTIYEMVALARDIFRPQNNCRTADEISIDIIETPRKQPKVFAYQ